MHDVKNTCTYKDLLLRWTHWYIKYLREKIYSDYNNVSCQGSMRTFSKHYSKCKTVSIKFRKILQERRLPNFHRITHKTIFWTFWLLKIFLCLYNIPRISLKYFWSRHSWYVPQIFWKHCFVINGICQKINICYYQIIQF